MAKSSLFDEVQAEAVKSNVRCKLAKIYASMSPEDQEALVSILENPKTPSAAIARVLTKRGLPISDASVKRCRQHECWKES